MTDYYTTNGLADDDRSDRYPPPQFIRTPNPAGRIAYAEVLENSEPVGVIWMAENKSAIPRAGIILTTINSSQFQNELGMHSLNYSRNNAVNATEWIELITATRDGQSGLAAGNEGYAPDLDTLRSQYPNSD